MNTLEQYPSYDTSIITLYPIHNNPLNSKIYLYFISTLNKVFPDYDFTHIQATQFIKINTLSMISIVENHLMLSLKEYLKQNTYGNEFWNTFDTNIDFENALIYQFIPNHDVEDNPLSSVGKLWSFHYLIYNDHSKKVACFSCSSTTYLHSAFISDYDSQYSDGVFSSLTEDDEVMMDDDLSLLSRTNSENKTYRTSSKISNYGLKYNNFNSTYSTSKNNENNPMLSTTNHPNVTTTYSAATTTTTAAVTNTATAIHQHRIHTDNLMPLTPSPISSHLNDLDLQQQHGSKISDNVLHQFTSKSIPIYNTTSIEVYKNQTTGQYLVKPSPKITCLNTNINSSTSKSVVNFSPLLLAKQAKKNQQAQDMEQLTL